MPSVDEGVGGTAEVAESSHALFRKLLETLPVPAYTCDASGLIDYFNRPAEELWGRRPLLHDPSDRFCGSFRLSLADGTPIAHDQCWMALALQNDRSYIRQEVKIGRPDGAVRTVLAHAHPIRDESGIVIGAVNLLVDISDRLRSEQAESMLNAVVESTQDAVVSRDLEGRVLSWNPGAERLFGIPAAEAIGHPGAEVVPADAREIERDAIAKLARGERVSPYETERIDAGGARRRLAITDSPILDPAGRVIGSSMLARDVTEQKRVIESLVAVKDELASQLADLRRLHSMGARLSTTLELRPIMEDALRTAAAVEGAQFGLLSLCQPDREVLKVGASLGFDEAAVQAIGDVPAGGGACGTCYERRRRVVIEDVETDPLFEDYRDLARRVGIRSVHSTPLITRTGKIVGVLSVHFREPHRPTDRAMHFVDLCARQAADSIENARLYGDLRETDRAKNEFLAVLAHELRNPLAPIRNAAQLLHLVPQDSAEGKEGLDVIDRQVTHMARLIDDLLDVARITGGKLELRRGPVDLAEVVRAATETSLAMIAEHEQELIVEMPAAPIPLDADLTRLAQVIANLLNNASKYSAAGSRIWLSVSRDGSEAVISVRDQGVGIPAHGLRQIFEIFNQGPAQDRAQGGLGIGLTLVKRLTEMHGGEVHARSDGADLGSEFIVRLPIAAAPVHAPGAKSAVPEPPAGRQRILIVDDNRDAADSQAMVLRLLGHEVCVAYDGREALAAAAEFRPAVVLLDIGLPSMNGYEVAREIRKQPWGMAARLIATTGWSQASDREKSRAAGFDHHLVKPVDPAELNELLRVAAA